MDTRQEAAIQDLGEYVKCLTLCVLAGANPGCSALKCAYRLFGTAGVAQAIAELDDETRAALCTALAEA